MDRLRQLINVISARMSDLTVSQRIAIGLCAALVAMSVLWLIQWASAPEMVPLVNYRFTVEELEEARETLRSIGKPFEVHGSRILVKASDRDMLIGELHTNNALPEGSLFDLGALVDSGNPFDPPEQIRLKRLVAKGNELAKIIETWPWVKSARVIINEVTRRRIGAPSDTPTASAAIILDRGEEFSDERVAGIASLIAGAVAGLKPHEVKITDGATGRPYSLPSPEEAVSRGYMDEVRKREKWYVDKIRDALMDIPNLRVTATVQLDADRKTKTTHTYNQVQPKIEDTEEEETSSALSAAEPGLHANVGQAITEPGRGASSTKSKGKTEYYPQTLKEQEVIEFAPYSIRKVTATVGIPRSYIIGLYRAKHAESAGITDVDLKEDREAQVARVKNTVVKIVMADPNDVTVDVYPDMKWDKEGASWEQTPDGVMGADQTASVRTTVQMIRGYGPQVGLGLLALMSLFMMLRMVRKSADLVPSLPSDDEGGTGEEYMDDGRVLSVGPYPVGEAELSDSMLTGHEVDDRTFVNRQLANEVGKMVEEDPRTAAELIKRWMEADE
jgi:flagellar M-ring protein FliF